jgi:putative ABC transport system permease protein
MDLLESVRMAWRAIRGHRLRSTLTTLGVIIGVASVITFVTLGASLQGAIIGEVAGSQSPNMVVSAGPQGDQGGGPPGSDGGQSVFTETDVDAVSSIEGVEAVVPQGRVALSGMTYHGQSLALSGMTTTTPAYFEYVARGNFSAGGPFESGEREVVLNEAAATLFATNVSAGDTVTVTRAGGESVNVTVVGIVEPGGGFGPGGDAGGQPQVYGPVDPFHETRLESPTTGERERVYAQLTVVAVDFEVVDDVADRTRDYFESESDAAELLPSSYAVEVQTNQEFVEQIQSVLSTFTGFITGIAVISLLVGAIGIANIMLVSVTERTREIGIMKAVGFQNRDILQLFLVEAVILGLVGSVFGVAVGVLGGYAATEFIGLPFTFPLQWAGIAVVVGVVVGAVAGLYPAWNGARIDPIEALRYE